MTGYFAGYATLGTLLLLGVGFVAAGLGANWVLRPHRPTPEKLATYECGVDPVGPDWIQTQIRYYVFAYLYVVFAVESVFLFPWATIFALPGFGTAALVEMGLFVGFLALGLLYAWRKKVLTWT
ncbi:MAG: NADH-quinone oxidoreductase subunit A [Pseudonocardiales bacterium]|nr:MAG: NADH-quinone oxidoreductase subunit A [Pseudonocardiales bacterium]